MADPAVTLRVSALEQEVEGEKLVTRHILEQTRRNGADIGALKADVSTLKSDVTSIKADLRSLSSKSDALQKNLPTMIADTMREVLRERDR